MVKVFHLPPRKADSTTSTLTSKPFESIEHLIIMGGASREGMVLHCGIGVTSAIPVFVHSDAIE